ncbi:16S rRNA (adenine(1518)-N(6)/adenine(1519)-N(6))-dimethyltransferase RsmA [Candidatus Parcubacteria bacterium]|nr:16S rRNA (adenine(1518)-N(6)/adenine(1519)-N(6))-dimethyltransferase RsmA [Candidatus Parcubacteria bacterium]
MVFAKKSLGQHFLRSTRALDAIIEAGDVRENDAVLEIGPGEGVLTKKLLAAGASVLAIEKDDELFNLLGEKFGGEIRRGKLVLEHGDVLDFNPAKPIAKSYKLIANIPYNITGAILEKFLSAEHQPSAMVLLVQDEVARRIVARDGKESILSISVKAYGTPRYVEKVLAGSFAPAPSVNSAIIAIGGISKAFFRGFSEEFFFSVLKAGFKSKRKKLSSNLSALFGREKVENAFQKLALNPNIRAEDVSLETWGQIAALLVI